MVHGRASTTTSGLKHQQRCAVHRNSHRTSPLGSTTSFAVKARYVGSTDFQTRKNEQHCHYCGLFLCACLSCRFVSVRFVSCVSYLVGNNNGDHDDDDDFASSMPLALHLFAISRSRLINPVGSALLSFVVSAEADWKTGVAAISQTRRSVHQFVLFATTVCGVTIIIIIMFGFSALRFGALRLSRVLVLLRKTIHFAFPLSVGTSTLIVSSEVGGCLVGTRRATMMLRSQSQSYESHKTFANERTTFRVSPSLSLSLVPFLSLTRNTFTSLSLLPFFLSPSLSLVVSISVSVTTTHLSHTTELLQPHREPPFPHYCGVAPTQVLELSVAFGKVDHCGQHCRYRPQHRSNRVCQARFGLWRLVRCR